jgi:hypothetical protein
LGKLDAVTALFHEGYLKIESARLAVPELAGGRNDVFYTFRRPVREVENSYGSNLFDAVFGLELEEFEPAAKGLLDAVIREDPERIALVLRGLLSGVAYMQHDAALGFCHGLVHIAFMVSGLNVLREVSGADGRADMSLFLPGDRRIVVEIKRRNSPKGADGGDIANGLDDALKEARNAIREKGYAAVFQEWTGAVACMCLAICGRRHVKAEFLPAVSLFGADGEATAFE